MTDVALQLPSPMFKQQASDLREVENTEDIEDGGAGIISRRAEAAKPVEVGPGSLDYLQSMRRPPTDQRRRRGERGG